MTGFWLLRIAVGAIICFLIAPLLMVILASFSQNSALEFPPRALTLQWYSQIPAPFIDSIFVSLRVAILTTVIAVVIALPAAVALTRTPLPGKDAISAFLLSPLMIPALIIGVGLFQSALLFWDMFRVSLLETTFLLVLGHLTFAIPFVLRAVLAGFTQFDASVEEAAQNLGASPARAFFLVTLPVLKQGIVSGGIFAFFMSLDDVPIALFVGGGANTTLPVRIFTSVEYSFGWEVMTVSSIIIACSLLILLVMDRLIGIEKIFGTAR